MQVYCTDVLSQTVYSVLGPAVLCCMDVLS